MATNNKYSQLPTYCLEHREEEIRVYCENCRVYVCDDCITGLGKHSKCTKTKLSEHGNKHRQSVLDFNTSADTHISRMNKVLDQTAKTQLDFNTSIDDNIKSIQSKREVLRTIFDELQSNLIKQFNDARKVANESFDKFADQFKQRRTRLKEISNEIQLKGCSIDGKEISFNDSQLKEILESSHTSELILKIEQPKYIFDDHYVKKVNLGHIMGYLDYGNYDRLQFQFQSPQRSKTSTRSTTEKTMLNGGVCNTDRISPVSERLDIFSETSSDFYGKVPFERKYITLKSFNLNKSVLHIVPTKQLQNAWIIGKEIGELDFSTEQPTYTCWLSSVDRHPITATRSETHGLLIGFSNSKTMKKVYFSENYRGKHICKLKSHINAHSKYLTAICTTINANADIAICLKEYPLTGSSEEKPTVILWYSPRKLKINEMCLFPSKVDIENPIHISESSNGDLCITCVPDDKSSWILLVDMFGNQKMRYPPKTDAIKDCIIKYSFTGAEFLKDGAITIMDKVDFRQHLISAKGELLQINKYLNKPSCFAVGQRNFIWMGFDNGEIQLREYENINYEEVQIRPSI